MISTDYAGHIDDPRVDDLLDRIALAKIDVGELLKEAKETLGKTESERDEIFDILDALSLQDDLEESALYRQKSHEYDILTDKRRSLESLIGSLERIEEALDSQ